MTVSVNGQLLSFCIMLLGGAASGVLADLFMLLRRALGSKRLTTNLADFLLWALWAVGFFALNFFVNDGELRFYGFLGLLLGAILYYLLLSRLVRVILGVVLKLLQKILGIFLKIVLTIFGFLYKILNSILLLFKRLLAPLGKGAQRAGDFVWRRWRGLRLVLKKK